MKIPLFVSCTQQKHKEDTLLYNSLLVNGILDVGVDIHFFTQNKEGLSKCYNQFLTEKYAQKHDKIIFVHDDVWFDDTLFNLKLNEVMYEKNNYDIVGVAGATKINIAYPTLWHIMSNREDYRGYAGHFHNDKKIMTGFGPTPDRVLIVDGVFVAVNLTRAIECNWKWNENFKFHHYDIASCIDANNKGLRIGVCPINLFHNSPGLVSLEDNVWQASNKKFLELYS